VTRHAENTDTQDNTDVNDLTSPSSHRWGISLSDTAEFRRAPSVRQPLDATPGSMIHRDTPDWLP
jgi:hypothetical protein